MPDNATDKKALIIDDDERSIKLLSLLLEDILSVETAVNGIEGLEKIKQQYFDVIISDVDMPLMNGIDLYYEAKATDPEIKKRFIFITASCKSHCISFFRSNNLRHLQKPSSANDIRNMVTAIIGKAES